ncbi:MAG: hypothetical protein ACFE8M_13325 [Candidatus Hermodarchaeota archaeon]
MKSINSIELTKGIAILCILLANLINYWLFYYYESRVLLSLLIVLFEIFGSFLYIFLFSFSVVFTLKKKMGCFPEKSNRNKVLKQAFFLTFLGFLYGIIANYIDKSTLIFWGWNILTFIGFGQLFCYYAFKLVRWMRIGIGMIIIFITPTIRELLYIGKESSPIVYALHQIFVSSTPIYPFLPFASVWFLSTVFAELIYESILLESPVANLNATRSIIKYGIIFIIFSFLYSAVQLFPFVEQFSFNPDKFPFIDAVPIYIPGLPEALVKGTIQNIFFTFGISLIVFSLIYYSIDINQRNNRVFNILIIFGKASITLLFLQWIFMPLFNQSLLYYAFLLITPIYLILFGCIIYFWEKYGNLKFSVEWLIRKVSKKISDEII